MGPILKESVNNVLQWVIASSADSNEVSLTIKGLLVSAVPAIMIALGVAHVSVGQDQVTTAIDDIIVFVQNALQIVGFGIAAIGALRKAWYAVLPAKP